MKRKSGDSQGSESVTSEPFALPLGARVAGDIGVSMGAICAPAALIYLYDGFCFSEPRATVYLFILNIIQAALAGIALAYIRPRGLNSRFAWMAVLEVCCCSLAWWIRQHRTPLFQCGTETGVDSNFIAWTQVAGGALLIPMMFLVTAVLAAEAPRDLEVPHTRATRFLLALGASALLGKAAISAGRPMVSSEAGLWVAYAALGLYGFSVQAYAPSCRAFRSL